MIGIRISNRNPLSKRKRKHSTIFDWPCWQVRTSPLYRCPHPTLDETPGPSWISLFLSTCDNYGSRRRNQAFSPRVQISRWKIDEL